MEKNRVYEKAVLNYGQKMPYSTTHLEEVIEVLRQGTEAARAAAADTLADVKKAMKIDYFESWAEEYGL